MKSQNSPSGAPMDRVHRVRRCYHRIFAQGFLIFLSSSAGLRSQTWTNGTGGSWSTAGNWNPASVPNSIGAGVTFNGAATASNVDQTANRAITLDGAQTIGTLLFNNDLSSFTNSLTTGASGSLTFDAAGTGPAGITTTGTGTGNNTISAPMIFADTVGATVNNTSASSAAGSLNLTGPISGPGGFVKLGDGLATFGTGAKTYTGATVLSGGRMRISNLAQPSMTSSFTIETGAQLTLIATSGNFTFGPGPLNLNGSGPTSGPFAGLPGAIRNDTNYVATINNPVVLQSDTLIHVQGATGSLTFTNSISGPGRLTLTAPQHDAALGSLILNAHSTYGGGTIVDGGSLVLSGANASLGLGNVTVDSASAAFFGASAKLTIQTGVLDAIADNATLSLAGGNVFGVADDGFLELQSAVNEIVGALVLGGLPQAPGTYGSTVSGAMFANDEYFSGTGIVTVVPEPASAAVLLAASLGCLGLKRRPGTPRTTPGVASRHAAPRPRSAADRVPGI